MDASAEFLLIKESSQGEPVGAGDHPHLRRVRTLKSPIRTGTIGRLSNSLLDTSSFSLNPAFHFGLLLGEGDNVIFIQSIQQIFPERLQYTKHCSAHWNNREQMEFTL